MIGKASIAALALFSSSLASAQQPPAEPWTVTVQIGPNFAGPAPAMAQTLRREGWSDSIETGGGTQSHPISTDGDFGWAARVGYRLHRKLGVALLYGVDELGFASGYRDDIGLYGRFHGFSPEVRTFAALASYHVGFPSSRLALRVDGGPASYTARVDAGEGEVQRTRLLVGGGATLDVWRLQLVADIQHRFVGDVEYGPYEFARIFEPSVVFPRSSADLGHTTFLLGVGAEF